jgi:hypothetical protein
MRRHGRGAGATSGSGPGGAWRILVGWPRLRRRGLAAIVAGWGWVGGVAFAGMGTATDPHIIATQADLLAMAGDTEKYGHHFKLMADLDLSGVVFQRAVIAGSVAPVGWNYDGRPFSGTFDGNGRTIRNLTIHAPAGKWVGLFGQVTGIVRDLILENCMVTGSGVVGGLCADNFFGTLERCMVTGRVQGAEYVGGLCGDNYGGMIRDCGVLAQVTASVWRGGGLCGRNYTGTILRCFAAGAVSGGGEVGGLTGNNNYGGSVSVTLNSFWDLQATGRATSAGGEGRTTAQMKSRATFAGAGWDFSAAGPWRMSNAGGMFAGYPCAGGRWDAGHVELGGGWRRLDWFGTYAPTGNGWFWHSRHGYFYPADISAPSGAYLYTMDMGWLFTGNALFPYAYRFRDRAWVWYLPDSAHPRWFRNLSSERWERW